MIGRDPARPLTHNPPEMPASKEIDGCGIAGVMSEVGKPIAGSVIVDSLTSMGFRYNGLGAGFAGYGIYPDYEECYALHIHFTDPGAKREVDEYLYSTGARVAMDEEIPHKSGALDDRGLLNWRYFVWLPKEIRDPDDYILGIVMHINRGIPGAYVFSSGKNMGVFKAVGYPEQVADYFGIERYSAYIWLGHGRYPTNTPGWWGGAHPFNILDWSVVHNGEISSYGTNKAFLEMWGYTCSLLTDTEVVAYLFDLLVRRHGLPLRLACKAMAPPFWSEIDRDGKDGQLLRALRMAYGGALLNGPFSIIVATNRFMLGLSDRIKLRPLIAARKGEMVYMASEECAIRRICPDPDRIWAPRAGEPVVCYLRRGERIDVPSEV